MPQRFPEVMGHWSQLIDHLEARPMAFYESVQRALEERAIPVAELTRIDWRESGLLSARREYLRVQRKEHVMDICGAPFGRGFFVSWWLGREQSPYGLLALLGVVIATIFMIWLGGKAFGAFLSFLLTLMVLPGLLWFFVRFLADQFPMWDDALAAMPLFGFIYRRWIRPFTYYRIDTALMFKEAVDDAVKEVIDGLTEAQGLRALSEAERKPVMRDFLDKMA